MRRFKLAFGVILMLASYVSMMVQFMLYTENVMNKNLLFKRLFVMAIVFIVGAGAVIMYRKNEKQE
jgi:hypothetical protein